MKILKLNKLNYKFWLEQKQIHFLINWRAGLDCFGNEIKPFTY